jgi:hypothetical protein
VPDGATLRHESISLTAVAPSRRIMRAATGALDPENSVGAKTAVCIGWLPARAFVEEAATPASASSATAAAGGTVRRRKLPC